MIYHFKTRKAQLWGCIVDRVSIFQKREFSIGKKTFTVDLHCATDFDLLFLACLFSTDYCKIPTVGPTTALAIFARYRAQSSSSIGVNWTTVWPDSWAKVKCQDATLRVFKGMLFFLAHPVYNYSFAADLHQLEKTTYLSISELPDNLLQFLLASTDPPLAALRTLVEQVRDGAPCLAAGLQTARSHIYIHFGERCLVDASSIAVQHRLLPLPSSCAMPFRESGKLLPILPYSVCEQKFTPANATSNLFLLKLFARGADRLMHEEDIALKPGFILATLITPTLSASVANFPSPRTAARRMTCASR